jgi:hypothetical protein
MVSFARNPAWSEPTTMRGLEEDSAKGTSKAILAESGGEFQFRSNVPIARFNFRVIGLPVCSRVHATDVWMGAPRMIILAILGQEE